MRMAPLFRCHRCNGRVNCIRKSGKKVNKYLPSKLEQLSAALNRLAATFVFDANTDMGSFYPVFREARRLREATEHGLTMLLALNAVVILTQLTCLMLGITVSYLDDLQTLFILILSIPASAVCCLASPTDNSIMKLRVVSPKYI